MTNTVFHAANSRGFADHGWLVASHSFSFASYRNTNRDNFGVLRVLNDDKVAAGMGFGEHAHDNMEIITIPLEGDLAHKDSMGNAETIKTGDVQVMSAGSGIRHSEFNPNNDSATKLFQIWLFPKIQNVTPRYQQITLDISKQKNNFAQILSPSQEDEGVWIYQDAWFYLSDFDADFSKKLSLKKEGNGFYIMNIAGEIEVLPLTPEGGINNMPNKQKLHTRDALGIWNCSEVEIRATAASKFLVMEVPMKM